MTIELALQDDIGIEPASVLDLFEEWARRTPSAIAVRGDGGTLTYGQLDAGANRLAAHLLRAGVRGEETVAVFLPRSTDLIVALLGIGKAGAAFTALETVSPAERLSFTLRDSGARIVVTTRPMAARLPGDPPMQRVCLEDVAHDPVGTVPGASRAAVDPAGLAAVMYTSGSTGKPKGVLIAHRSIAQHATFVRGCYDIEPSDTTVLFAPPNFDGTLEQIFSTLIAGATLVVPEDLWPAADFYRKVVELGITIVNPPVAYWRSVGHELSRTADTLPPVPLKLVIIGGDAMLPDDVKGWSRTPFVTKRLIHCYGPTETTVYVTNTDVPTAIEGTAWEQGIPIGWPVADRTVYLLDEAGTLIADGCAGDLYIGGKGLARGYLNRPDLTARVFVPDPFSAVPGARMYRTGDRARCRPDGAIEFLGRVDEQVKIRGNRVEPREVEQALRGLEGISEAVVVARSGPSHEKQLVAYLVSAGPKPTTRTIQQSLAETLPPYMFPAYCVFLDRLPVTATGKIDRAALPDVTRDAPATFETDARNETERLLAEIWHQVLGVPRVGRLDNFLELGGDSILGLQVVARANELGFHLTHQDAFLSETLADLAVAAAFASDIGQADVLTGDVPLTPIQQMFCERGLEVPNHFNQTLMLRPLRPLDPAACRQVVAHLLMHHDALRLRVRVDGRSSTQHYDFPGDDVPFEYVDLSACAPSERPARMREHAAACQASLDLEQGPICRAVLYALGDEQRLFFVAHHIAVDTVSWRILVDDFSRCYKQEQAGGAVATGAKTTSYREWAERLHEQAADPGTVEEVAYWEAQLAGAAADLPIDTAGPNVAGSEEVISLALDERDTEALMSLTRRHGLSPADVMICALGEVLLPWLGAERAVVDVESHGRDAVGFPDVDLSKTVGWFTTVFPFALTRSAEQTPAERLHRVAGELRGVPRGGLGHGLLAFLSPDPDVRRRLARLPAAQVSFNYVGHWDVGRAAEPLVGFARDDSGPSIDARERRRYLLDVGALISGTRLKTLWTFSRQTYRAATVQWLAARHVDEIRRLIAAIE